MNYYLVYQRGDYYRVGRRRWWGLQWFKEYDVGGPWVFQTENFSAAKAQANRANDNLDLCNRYDKDHWKVVP